MQVNASSGFRGLISASIAFNDAWGSALRAVASPPCWQQQLQGHRQLHTAEVEDAPIIEKLLIANRGEIACRIIRTAKRMGIKTVAIYSVPDKDSLHVRHADEAVCVGPAQSLQSYLNVGAVMDAIRRTGATAVHPGYGFLSENAAFAHHLESQGISFVGPPASAIRSLGDKVESKRIAKAAGINTIPGFVGAITDDAHATAVAGAMGYPVMIKASAGGGGKGMRIAWSQAELREQLHLAKAEALAAFGDDTLLIEKYVVGARHIEFQVLGDKHGQLVYLPERDCSVQRRNQKVLEESPSPFMTPQLRAAMGQQAVALARSVGYYSTGTVEFVVDHQRNFYFLEMNTRLQVEHPVTEAVSRLDLVEQMLRVAAGQKLSISQERAAAIDGWAIEARVYAEDPARNFAPSPGRLKVYHEPTAVPGIRLDTGVVPGDAITPYYDPMISKLVASAPSRQQALDRLAAALDAYVVRGLGSNLALLRAMLGLPDFRSGEYDTGFIPRHYATRGALSPLAFPLTPEQQEELLAAAVYITAAEQLRLNPGAFPAGGATQLAASVQGTSPPPHQAAMAAEAAAATTDKSCSGDGGSGPVAVWVRRATAALAGAEAVAAGALEVQLPDRVLQVVQRQPGEGGGPAAFCPFLHELVIDGKVVCVQVVEALQRGLVLQHCGAQRLVLVQTPAAAALAAHMPPTAAAPSHKRITSPMTGTLVELGVAAGQAVREGDSVAVVEAMKMRNSVRAPCDGVVAEVAAAVGSMVQVDALLVRLQ